MSTLIERLEGRVLLSAADIDLVGLLARAAAPSFQTSGIVDAAGNHYSFSEGWGPKPDEHTPRQRETYVSKISPAGGVIWTKTVAQNARVQDVAFDGSDLWAAGSFNYNLSSGSGMGIWRFSDDPTRYVRVHSYGSNWNVADIRVDRAGNAIVMGNIGGSRVVLKKVSSTGELLWTKLLDGNGSDTGSAIATSLSGEIVIAGTTGSSDLPGAVNAPEGSRFVARYAPTGELLASAYVSDTNHALVRWMLAADTYGTDQADTIVVAPANLNVNGQVRQGFQVTVNGFAHAPVLPDGALVIHGGLGNDHIVIQTEVKRRVLVYGGEGNDTVLGGSGSDTLIGGRGADVLVGRLGNDAIHGEGDDRYVTSEMDGDVLEGGEGDDSLWGNDGNDTLYGHDGNDVLSAGGGAANELYGNAGDDTLKGGGGDDYLTGNDGLDLIEYAGVNGTAISEQYLASGVVYSLEAGRLRVTGTPGGDYLWITESEGYLRVDGWRVAIADIREIVIDLGTGNDRLWTDGLSVGATVFAGAGNDTIYAGRGNDLIYGGAGNDLIHGDDSLLAGGGNDTIYGNFGDDTILAMGGADQVFAGLDNDAVDGGDGNDTLLAGDGTDVVHGGAGDDYVEGRGKADTIYGGIGNDTLIGGAGADQIYGEAGTDFLDASPHVVFHDTVDGGVGDDIYSVDADDVVVEFGGEAEYQLDGVRYLLTGNRLQVFGTSSADTIEISERGGCYWVNGWTWAIPNASLLTEIEVNADAGDDRVFLIVSSVTNAIVYGGDGNDVIRLGDGDDEAYGGGGNDHIWGLTGNDALYGGSGADWLNGEDGDDRLFGGEGEDDLAGGYGADYLDGGGDWRDYLNPGPAQPGLYQPDEGDVVVR